MHKQRGRHKQTVYRSFHVHDALAFASTQEEADIRMLLHAGFVDANFAARGVQGTVVIRSPDTCVSPCCELLSQNGEYSQNVV